MIRNPLTSTTGARTDQRANVPARGRRRGSAYLLVLSVALIVTTIGLSGLIVARVGLREATDLRDTAEATELAFAAVEHALSAIDADGNWRSTYLNDQPITPIPLGSGTFSWKLVDPDNDLDNDPNDPMRIWGIGVSGQAMQMCSVLYDPSGGALDVLRTAIHADDGLTMATGYALTASGGPVSTNGTLYRWGTIVGDAEAVATSGAGSVTGTLIEPADVKQMPLSNTFDSYAALATEIPFGDLDMGRLNAGPLLSSAVNPYGPTNPNGVYLIQVPSWYQLRIQIPRIQGTLVIDAEAGSIVRFDQPILVEPHHPALPSILINASNVKVHFDSAPTPLNESVLGVNLNPAGTPYNNEVDNTLDDTYPSELRGLIHVLGPTDEVSFINGINIVGSVIVDGPVLVHNATITHDPNIQANPPQGYGLPWPGPDPTTWRRETLP